MTAEMTQYEMVEVDKAVQIALSKCSSNPTVDLDLTQLLGHVASCDVHSSINIPQYPTSIKDGYALQAFKSSETKSHFDLLDTSSRAELRPEEDEDIRLTGNQACYITTGAPLPLGANAVVEVEQTAQVSASETRRIQVNLLSVSENENVRLVGSDIKLNEVILKKGQLISSIEIGVLAMCGVNTVSVYRRPRVGILSTGNELVDVNAGIGELKRGQVYDANRPLLISAAIEFSAGFAEVLDLGIAGDSEEGLQAKLQEAILMNCDILVTSGGVSMGDKDLMKSILKSTGTIHFGKLFMKPGKPCTFASIRVNNLRSMLVFSLPGNPTSSYVTFQLIVVPCLRKISGFTEPCLNTIHVKLKHQIKLDPIRPEFHRAMVLEDSQDEGSSQMVAVSTGFQRSSRLTSCAFADVLIKLPSSKQYGGTAIPAGSLVESILIRDLRLSDSLKSSSTKPMEQTTLHHSDLLRPVAVLFILDDVQCVDIQVERQINSLFEGIICRTVAKDASALADSLDRLKLISSILLVVDCTTGTAISQSIPSAVLNDKCDIMLPGFGEVMRSIVDEETFTLIASSDLAGFVQTTLVISITAWQLKHDPQNHTVLRSTLKSRLAAVWPAAQHAALTRVRIDNES